VCYKEAAVVNLLGTEIEGRRPYLVKYLDEWNRLQAFVEDRA
jgi:hypothetical protein